jgi:hypothetical protein
MNAKKKKNILTYLLCVTNFTELSPFGEAANCPATKKIPSNLLNPKVHYCSQELSNSPCPEPGQFSPYHPSLSKITFTITDPPTYVLVFLVVSFLLAFH